MDITTLIKKEIELIEEYKKDKSNWSKNKYFTGETIDTKEEDSDGNKLSDE